MVWKNVGKTDKSPNISKSSSDINNREFTVVPSNKSITDILVLLPSYILLGLLHRNIHIAVQASKEQRFHE